MINVFRRDLKIEFRAVPYVQIGRTTRHVLEYRISPDQDLTYNKTVSWLWGLIKFTRKCKLSTEWVKAEEFVNYPSAYLFEEHENYLPIFIDTRDDLAKYKNDYKTIGDFYDMIDKYSHKERIEWQKERYAYLNDKGIWE